MSVCPISLRGCKRYCGAGTESELRQVGDAVWCMCKENVAWSCVTSPGVSSLLEPTPFPLYGELDSATLAWMSIWVVVGFVLLALVLCIVIITVRRLRRRS
jgi:hypothetical protein